MLFDIRFREGRIEIEPSPLPVKLVRKGKLLVATPETDIVSLTEDTVEQIRRAIRRGRAGRV